LDTHFFVFSIQSKGNSGRGTLAPRSKREAPSGTTMLDPRIKREVIVLDPLLPVIRIVLFIFWSAGHDFMTSFRLVVVYEESLQVKIGGSTKNTSKGSNAFGNGFRSGVKPRP
jgi:hypothetical protein